MVSVLGSTAREVKPRKQDPGSSLVEERAEAEVVVAMDRCSLLGGVEWAWTCLVVREVVVEEGRTWQVLVVGGESEIVNDDVCRGLGIDLVCRSVCDCGREFGCEYDCD